MGKIRTDSGEEEEEEGEGKKRESAGAESEHSRQTDRPTQEERGERDTEEARG